MKIVIGSDHAGFELKEELKKQVEALGHEVTDVGTHSTASCDYPDFAAAVGEAVAAGQAERGIVLCGSGVGAGIVANKVRGIRAGICHDTYSAHQGVEHDDMNVLVVGARIIGSEVAKEIVRSFLGARFTDEERHRRRLGKLLAVESRYSR
ncbi:MAG: ribose 5-phosphate isomerase B [Deltaproteobacteria bacterium]|jgi:RpiB/LacA/LacB family sugar-phosphate isomerase|nr:ribose 5-phosphate isomerase B [Deltaproteobacteria bacterium]